MPLLKDVLPAAFAADDTVGAVGAGESPVGALRDVADVAVVATKLTTGSPCDGHQELFADWPGPDRFVRQWFILENGKAVGINEDPEAGNSYPVVDYDG